MKRFFVQISNCLTDHQRFAGRVGVLAREPDWFLRAVHVTALLHEYTCRIVHMGKYFSIVMLSNNVVMML